MKQIDLTDTIREQLKTAVGADVNFDNLAVFRATAINTAPVRKKHPVYNGAVHSRGFLQQMLDSLAGESRPLQIMHGNSDGDQLPIGRVFAGQLSDGTGPGGATELEVLFWVDKTTGQKYIDLVNNGTVDQVSVAILGKEALSNKTGFDFLGPDATLENIWGGVDDKGNRMGEDGAHVIVNNLDSWFEMSLVGQGGIQGAKIHGRGAEQRMHLVASDQDVPSLTLMLSTGETPPTPGPKPKETEMDAAQFAATVAEHAGKAATEKARADAAEARATELQTKLDAANAKVTELSSAEQATKLTAAEAKVTELNGQVEALSALPKTLLAPLFAAAGQPSFDLPAKADEAIALVKEKVEGIKAMSAAMFGRARDAASGSAGSLAASNGNGAFKRR